ncbi:MAG TPA: patatin [Pasteurellaceae bacterium]|nr:patatin [Pasteurellaceae bacterium]
MNKSHKTIGLALSGGGHKGLAHAGVLQFLQEQGIEAQVIAGTSAGSIVGSLYALGKKPAEILDFFQSVNLFSLNHLSFGKGGLLDAEKFIIYLDDIFGDMTLAELKRDLYISATNIETGRTKIFNRNVKVKEAVAASSAFPGVFSPVLVEGHLYSDGGILNNFPVNTIQGRCDFLIGVNLDPSVGYKSHVELNSIKSVTLRVMNIMMAYNAAFQNTQCDWNICPQRLREYNVFETSKKRIKEIYLIGYEEAAREFEQIKHKIMD